MTLYFSSTFCILVGGLFVNKLTTAAISLLTSSSLIFGALPVTARADETSSGDGAQVIEINGGDISFQYISTVYNGREQKPSVTIRSGDTTLIRDTDFTVTYPEDCINAGKKTVNINCIGKYKGQFSATYMIEPLDCSDPNTNVGIKLADCFYTGLPLTPDVSVTANGMTLKSGDLSLAFSDNINITGEKKAKCVITFRGNYTGSRTAEFEIAKTPMDDLDLEMKVKGGERITYDLTPLTPDGARLGAVKYYSWDRIPEHQPKIAFNILTFTVPDSLTGSTVVAVPVLDAPNCEDHRIVFYPTVTDKIIPKIVMKDVEREYDGKPVSEEEIANNGSYATVNGEIIGGSWEFWTEPPTQTCIKQPVIVTFKPDDERYAEVDSVTYITVARKKAAEFTLKTPRAEIPPFRDGQLVISGIPEDYKGTLTLKCGSEDDELKIIEVGCDDITRREYKVEFPLDDARYIFTAELSGDSIYLPASSQCSITVGDHVPPEDKPSDNVTTPEELTALIEHAAEGGTVKAEGIRKIPWSILDPARAKKLTLAVKINDSFTWVIDTAKILPYYSLDLDISMAVIPASLLDKIGGRNLYSFNVSAKGLGSGGRIQVTDADSAGKFANLFLYDTSGELKFVSCAPIAKDGKARLDISKPGKYAVIADSETKLMGDFNNDCVLDVDDVMKMLYFIANEDPNDNTDISKYDMNSDKELDVNDVMKLLYIIANSYY